MTGPVEYALAQGVAFDHAVARLERRFAHRAAPAVAIERTFYDTFDWRVHRRGAVLEATSEVRGSRLTWRDVDWKAVHGRVPVTRPVGSVADLPDGPFRSRLGDVVAPRALLPVASVRGKSRSLRLEDRDGKVVLRVFVEHDMRADAPGRAAVPLVSRVLLSPVRGYEGPADRFRQAADSELGLVPLDDLSTRALAAVGRRPGDYSARPTIDLVPEMPATTATALAFTQFLELIEANVAGIVNDVDTGFLLDARVALRRARSLLKELAAVAPAAVPAALTAELAWLGQATGPTRDLDVQLQSVRAAATIEPDLIPLLDVLETRRRDTHAALVDALRSHRCHALLGWKGASREGSTSHIGPTIGAVARRSIERSYERVVRHGRAVRPDSHDTALHRLRRRGKELRYALEFYRTLLSAPVASPVVGALRDLQHTLGEFNDCAAQEALLRQVGPELHDPRARIATGELLDGLTRRQQEARTVAMERIARLSRTRNRERVLHLLSRIPESAT